MAAHSLHFDHRPPKNTVNLQDCKGHWALVTGASAGIGREFCLQLAAAGMNLVMVARQKNLMDELAEELVARHGTHTLVVPIDLSRPNAAAEVKSAVAREGLCMRIIINNAAFGRWGRFEAAQPEECEEIIRLNTAALVSLCHHFLPDLTRFSNSAIINVSSPAGWQPMPYFAVYAATKAFVNSFSLALYAEWGDRGVLVQTLVPGPTQTGLHAKGGAYRMALQDFAGPTVAVEAALKSLSKDIPMVISARGAYRQRLLAHLLPTKIVVRLLKRMFQPPVEP
jgi:uncharacterized protein